MQFNYEKLTLTKNIQNLIVHVYELTAQFPDFERFGLTSQLQRSITSVLLNLAEGSARKSKPEFVRFLNISIGSLVEADAIMKLAVRIGYIPETTRAIADPLVERTYFQLVALKRSQGGS